MRQTNYFNNYHYYQCLIDTVAGSIKRVGGEGVHPRATGEDTEAEVIQGGGEGVVEATREGIIRIRRKKRKETLLLTSLHFPSLSSQSLTKKKRK